MSYRPPLTHVAIRFHGTVYSLPAPNRHHNVIRLIVDTMNVDSVDGDQGFLDADGRFLSRRSALVSARLNHQLKSEPRGVLTSEDLW